MRAQLFRVHNPPGGRKIIIEKGLTLGPDTLIGRGMSSYVRVNHPNVSERHAQIFRGDDGLFRILHLGEPSGANVTLVNGEKVVRRVLLPGDEISFPGTDELFKFVTKSERVAVLMNDGTIKSIERLAKFAVQLEKRGFTVILLTPDLVVDQSARTGSLENDIKMMWRINGEKVESNATTDYRSINGWLAPFTSKYNEFMDYLLVLVSRCNAREEVDILPQVSEIVSRVQAINRVILSREISDSPGSLKEILTYVSDSDIEALTRKMGSIFQRFGRRKYDEFEIPDQEGGKLIVPARQDKFF